jgi:hypothetical protein
MQSVVSRAACAGRQHAAVTGAVARRWESFHVGPNPNIGYGSSKRHGPGHQRKVRWFVASAVVMPTLVWLIPAFSESDPYVGSPLEGMSGVPDLGRVR